MNQEKKELKKLINSKRLEFIMEAHSGISAKIVESAGFSGVWASGLAISTLCGVRDCNELSWTQLLSVVEFIVDAINIPVLVDIDSGFGDYNIVRRVVQKLENIKVAGVCIEDKLFPKMNSFYEDRNQKLASVADFCGKVKAAKEIQKSQDFCVLARTEAFVVGMGVEEALSRAYAYADVGADAIVVHSKSNTADEIISFMKQWDNRVPIVIIPTSYANTPTKVFEDIGISMVIWGNHNMRASIYAMRESCEHIFREQSVANAKRLVSVKEIFEMTNMAELSEADKKYLG